MGYQPYYIERGEGFPLILLHGNGESSDYFANQLDELSRFFRVIAVDTRGHGRSPRGEGDFSLERFADDLGDLLLSLGIDRAHILGFSDGANIALLFALKRPERVARLVLNGGNLFPSGVKARFQLPITLGYALSAAFAPLSRRASAAMDMLGLMVTQPHIEPASLAALAMPVLVVAGKRDMIKTSHTRLIADSIPGAELRLLDGDHFVAAGNSAEYNSAVLEFLTRKPFNGRN